MPQVTVYVRKDDLDKWKDLKGKANTIHKLLNRDVPPLPINTPKSVAQVLNVKLCKHGFDPNFCKFAKPGKPCK